MTRPFPAAVVTIAAASAALVCASCDTRPQTPSCLVSTPSGDVQGVDQGESCAFLGIPFAVPPIGDLRWKPPQPARAWAPAVLQATALPSICPQVSRTNTGVILGDEDCLRLNIWMPNPPPASPAPVIVWIHDGAFASDSANLAAHDARKAAERTGTIVVAANYRIGPFGFLAHPALTAEDPELHTSGNYGLLDQRAALAWVRGHIAAFGGNRDEVTIAGESAGADSVSLHIVSPGSAGYFSRAIMQNGYASSRWRTLADAESLGQDFATALGCANDAQVVACLRTKTIEEVLFALPTGQPQFAQTARAPWGPIVDGQDIPEQPRRLFENGAFNHVPMVVGATREEGWIYVDRSFPATLTPEVYEAEVEAEFGTADASAIRAKYPLADFKSPKHALARITGDVESVCEAQRIARLVEQARTPVRLYSFDDQAEARNFVFGKILAPPSDHVSREREATCEFWEPFFLRSVIGSVPASQP